MFLHKYITFYLVDIHLQYPIVKNIAHKKTHKGLISADVYMPYGTHAVKIIWTHCESSSSLFL